ncbi:MAG: hypothetical protein J6C82_06860 [Clostridia bacterium]|nr:hypothetical protein [Clostridia bacterium]
MVLPAGKGHRHSFSVGVTKRDKNMKFEKFINAQPVWEKVDGRASMNHGFASYAAAWIGEALESMGKK